MNVQRYVVICNGATELEVDIAAAVFLETIGELTMPSGTAMFQMVKTLRASSVPWLDRLSRTPPRCDGVTFGDAGSHRRRANETACPRLATREGAI